MYLILPEFRTWKLIVLLLIFICPSNSLRAQLNGIYSVGGTGSNYETISLAVADLIAAGINGSVTFQLNNGTYDEQIIIPNINGNSGVNTITFESVSGNPEDVLITYGATGAADNFIFHLNNTSNVIIKNLSFETTGTLYGRNLWMTNRGDNILIENCKLTSAITSSTQPNMSVIWFEPSASSDIRFLNNSIIGGSYGIYYQGESINAPSPGTIIHNNSIQDFHLRGLFLRYLLDLKIENNQITTQNNYSANVLVYISNCNGSLGVTGNTILGGNGTAFSIQSCFASSVNPGLIANNFISNYSNNITFSFSNNKFHKIYHNSVNNTGYNGIAFYYSGGEGNNLLNNIFKANTGYAINFNNSTGLNSSNYNNFFNSGAYLGRWGTININDLLAWQNTTGQDANSYSLNPQFLSNTDLHATGLGLSDAGIALAEVAIDIDGDLRNNPPSIGADEYISDPLPTPLNGIYSVGGTGSNYETISLAVADLIAAGINGSVTFQLNNGTYDEQIIIPNISGNSGVNTITFESLSGNPDDVLITYGATGAADNFIFHLNNTSNVIIKNLSFEATGTPYGRNLWMTNRGDNILIENCKLTSAITSSTQPNMSVIWFEPSASSDIRFLNNSIIGGSYGIYYQGESINAPSPGTIIHNNSIQDFHLRGLFLRYLLDLKIENNQITTQNNYSANVSVDISNCHGSLGVTGNTILGLNGTAFSIQNCFASFVNPGLIANNFISSAGTNAFYFFRNKFQKIYHNSVHNSGTGNAFYYTGWISGEGNNLLNNIFKANTGYAVNVDNSMGLYACDYNDFFSAGAFLGSWDSTETQDLLAWQNTTGRDANSYSLDPQFLSNTDLHATGPGLSDAGIAVAEVAIDIDGDLRNSPPSIGADEYISDPLPTPLNGIYSIGGIGSDYETLSLAVADLIAAGINGPVTFQLNDGIYDEQIIIPNVNGNSDVNTITFESVSGNPEDVLITYGATGVADNYIFHLNSASNIIIKNLSFETTGTLYGRNLWMTNRGDNILIENCKLTSAITSSTHPNMSVIWFEPSASSDIRFLNNNITGGSYGIYYQGESINAPSPGTIIRDNVIQDFHLRGLSLRDLLDLKIENNRITSQSIRSYGYSVSLSHCNGSLVVTGNKISGNSGKTFSVDNCEASFVNPGLISNNFISSTGINAFYFFRNKFQNIYHNSVHNSGTGNAFYYEGYNTEGNNLLNNIFKANTGYAVYVTNSTGLYACDYNDFFSGGAFLGSWDSTETQNLLAWQNTTGRDANSYSLDPQFLSNTDLHATGPGLSDAGIAVAEVAIDIDGDLRNSPPSIGADEYISDPLPTPLNGIYSIGGIGSDYETLSLAVADLIAAGINGPVTFQLNNGIYDEQIIIPNVNGKSSLNTITFESVSGNPEDVLITYGAIGVADNYIFHLNNTSNIIIKNLSFEATGTPYGRNLWMTNRGDDILIENCKLTSAITSLTHPNMSVIWFEPSVSSNIRLLKNNITGGSYGIYYRGDGANTPTPSAIIRNNLIKDFRFRGLDLQSLSDLKVESNRITTQNNYSANVSVNISNCNGSLRVRGNTILGDLGVAFSIQNCYSSFVNPGLISNNFISSTGTNAFYFFRNKFQNIYHNSVQNYGNGNAFYYYGNGGEGNNLLNNIFKANTGNAVNVNNSIGLNNSNYNDFFSSGAYLGRWGTSDIQDFQGWQNISSRDTDSRNLDPLFLSNTNLHATEPGLSDAGIAVAEVGLDIDEEPRKDPPSIGADEYGYLHLILSSSNNPATCSNLADGNIDLTVTGGSPPYTYDWDNDEVGINDLNPDSEDIGDLLPGNYTVIVTDVNNLTETLTLEILANQEAVDWFIDSDGDGYGDLNTIENSCEQPTGYVADNTDCNDGDVAINPEAVEVFDGVDNNCDGLIDEGFTDADSDGFAAELDDCNDGDVAINPGAVEVFDGVDNNCDGLIDEGFTDADSDGFAAELDDCNDGDVAINPGAVEVFDGVDNNCDGLIDEGFTDADSDGFAAELDDCNDGDVAINPGAVEVFDGVDNNCDGLIDEGFTDADSDGFAAELDDCNDGDVAINPGAVEVFDGVDNNCDGIIDEGFTDADSDGFAAELDDCNDGDVAINPGAVEVFDGVDNNCDGLIDEGFTDADSDGFAAELDDCNDGDVAINPGAVEVFDGVDNNCDGLIDEGFTDADSDGFAAELDDCNDGDVAINPGAVEVFDGVDNNCDGLIDEGFTDADSDGFAAELDDCNDGDVAINPGAVEVFDGVDNNCDGLIDEGFTDADSDGFAAELDDCNDGDVAINPGAVEVFDGVDNNCDGLIDEGFTDADSDGFAAELDDCNDGDVAINPGAVEVFDGVDNNCDGLIDEGFTDADSDGFAAELDDCNDGDVAINPGAVEVFDGVDNNCDGLIDEGFTDADSDGFAAELDDCNDGDVAINPGAVEVFDGVDNNCDGLIDEGFTDADSDGFAAELDDCNDGDVAINPGAVEVFDGVDNNCDGLIDEGFTDADSDGFAAELDDCNDGDVAINPGAVEVFDGVDNNCDGLIDEGFTDADSDGFAAELDDCNDGDVAINPGAVEVFDGVDNNCDGLIDEGFTDADSDGFAAELDDCNDGDVAINPGAVEVFDGVDNNCDGIIDEGFTDADSDGFAAELDDCNDGDVAINPGAVEVFDGVDNNCDGIIDEGFTDADSDGFAAELDDCNDGDVAINPGAVEVFDGVDNNCDGLIDEGFTDADSDGFAAELDDCNDGDVAINPGAVEVFDGVDNNCDGLIDEGFTDADSDGFAAELDDCNDGDVAINPGAVEVFDGVDNNCDGLIDEGFTDADSDGFAAELDDCNDGDVAINPGAVEVFDGVDNNCDGLIDEGFTDADSDGFAAELDDCNDGDVAINPGAVEVFDGVDNNCDGLIDEGFTDADSDGFAAELDDCNDGDVAINPGAVEVFDGVDNNCDGLIDEGFTDADSDGFAAELDDCNDGDVAINPGAVEVFDGVDNNCDGLIDEGFTDADSDGFAAELDDCNDGDVAINPGAVEVFDGVDNNCDGLIDEGFTDADSDGFAAELDDCNDGDVAINPGAVEVFDGVDNNCDGLIDEGFTDADSDGFAAELDDCNDGDVAINPGAVEVFDGVDNNCDGLIDEGFTDADSDGFAAELDDCNDGDVAINPGAVEVFDGVDNNCDGLIDEGFTDADSDGYAAELDDCNDEDVTINPGEFDIRGDGIDQDCDGVDQPLACIGTEVLIISEVCTNTQSLRNWIISNPSNCAVEVRWLINRYIGMGGVGRFIANPGNTYLTTPANTNGKTQLNIYWKDRRGKVKKETLISKVELCVLESSIELTESKLEIYPNPMKDEGLWMKFADREKNEIFFITVHDLYGRLIDQIKLDVNKKGGIYHWPLDHSGWEQGVYVFKAKSDSEIFNIKLIK